MNRDVVEKIEKAIEILEDFGNPKKWELLGGHYYRCRGKSNAKTNKWPHELVQEAITLLRQVYKGKKAGDMREYERRGIIR